MTAEVLIFLFRIGLAVSLNALLFAKLVPWVARQLRRLNGWERVAFGLGLALRVGVGLARNWHLALDAGFFKYLSDILSEQLWTDPQKFWRMMTQPVTILTNFNGYNPFVYQLGSNTWNLAKILTLLNLGSLGCPQVNVVYLSLFSFVGCWMLVQVLLKRFPDAPAGAGFVALLFWPSVWFWATGLSKEALLLGSGAWLTARVLSWLYAEKPELGEVAAVRGWGWWAGTAALALVHVVMRYFFGLPLLAVLAGLAMGKGLQRLLPQRWAVGVGLAAVFGAGLWLLPQLSVAFRPNKFVNQVLSIYNFDVAHSAGRLHFEYPGLRPTAGSIAAHAPLAVANALSQPWLGQSREPLYIVAGLENAGLLLLLAVAAWALVRQRNGHLPFALVLSLGVFCLLLAFLMGITTPNLGSLHRYRSAMLPYLLLLLLQNDYAAAALQRLRLHRRPLAGPLPGLPRSA